MIQNLTSHEIIHDRIIKDSTSNSKLKFAEYIQYELWYCSVLSREHAVTIGIMWHILKNLMMLFFGRCQPFMMFICSSNSYSDMDFVTFNVVLMLF